MIASVKREGPKRGLEPEGVNNITAMDKTIDNAAETENRIGLQ